MKRKIKNKEAAHLQKKMGLYESFLYRYLPQMASLSFITRLNLFDLFGSPGLDRLGAQGTPFTLYRALAKQRQHQHKKKQTLKPFSLSLVSFLPQSNFSRAVEQLQQQNMQSNTCRFDTCTPSSLAEGIRELNRLIRKQAASEKNLLFLDPLGIVPFSPAELRLLAERKAETVLFLPVKILWQLHSKPEKVNAPEEFSTLKESIDNLFPQGHEYWSENITPPDFFQFLKEAFRLEGLFYTALEPAPEGENLPEAALLALTGDAFIMEKILHSLQPLRPTLSTPPGEQLLLFSTNSVQQTPTADTESIINLLQEEKDNRKIYEVALQAGILPSQLLVGLNYLVKEGQVEIRDAKRKPLSAVPPTCIGYTAFKAPASACFFRKRD